MSWLPDKNRVIRHRVWSYLTELNKNLKKIRVRISCCNQDQSKNFHHNRLRLVKQLFPINSSSAINHKFICVIYIFTPRNCSIIFRLERLMRKNTRITNNNNYRISSIYLNYSFFFYQNDFAKTKKSSIN